MNKKALVLFSGGQDSTTCLAWSLEKFDTVETLSIYYGQRNSIELNSRKNIFKNMTKNFPNWKSKLKENHLINLPDFGKINKTSLTSEKAFKIKDNKLPNSFVPGRNIFFFSLAAALAYGRDIRNIVAGVCQTDFQGYPDCRSNTINAIQLAINLGMEKDFNLITPLMWMDKSDTWKLASSIGGKKLINIIIKDTHTCYKGVRKKLHDWGYGCDNCPACKLRSNGWKNYINK